MSSSPVCLFTSGQVLILLQLESIRFAKEFLVEILSPMEGLYPLTLRGSQSTIQLVNRRFELVNLAGEMSCQFLKLVLSRSLVADGPVREIPNIRDGRLKLADFFD
jgi:hypothetical protein